MFFGEGQLYGASLAWVIRYGADKVFQKLCPKSLQDFGVLQFAMAHHHNPT
jgi:hypothetical protein